MLVDKRNTLIVDFARHIRVITTDGRIISFSSIDEADQWLFLTKQPKIEHCHPGSGTIYPKIKGLKGGPQ